MHNYLPQIRRAARASGLTPQRADDVTQATFQAFIEAASRFEGRSKMRTFVFGILYRKIAEARRETTRDALTDSIEDVMEGRFRADGKWLQPPRALDQQLFLSEIGSAIEACLDQAPTRQRLAFVLREIDGISSEELCNILGVSRTKGRGKNNYQVFVVIHLLQGERSEPAGSGSPGGTASNGAICSSLRACPWRRRSLCVRVTNYDS